MSLSHRQQIVAGKMPGKCRLGGDNIMSRFLDPVGSLVSTLWVVVGCGWVVTLLSKIVNFECVGMLEC